MLIFQPSGTSILPTWQPPQKHLAINNRPSASYRLRTTMVAARQQVPIVASLLALTSPSAHAFTAIQQIGRTAPPRPATSSRVRPRAPIHIAVGGSIHTNHACGRRHIIKAELSALSLSASFSRPLPSPSNPLIPATDDMGNASAVLMCATIAQFLGKSTAIGRLLGPPVTAMALTFLLASIGIMPPRRVGRCHGTSGYDPRPRHTFATAWS